MKNLIISSVGDNSFHKSWMGDNIDLMLYYYGNNEEKIKEYKKDSKYFFSKKINSKYDILQQIIVDNFSIINKYEYIWLPDDDLDISYNNLCKMFAIMKKYDLWIAQPSVIGNINIEATAQNKQYDMRYTNLIEIMGPAFKLNIFLYLSKTFGITKSMWGVENFWSILLGCPDDKLAIIDCISMNHTKQSTEAGYNRFGINPYLERQKLFENNKNMIIESNCNFYYSKGIIFSEKIDKM